MNKQEYVLNGTNQDDLSNSEAEENKPEGTAEPTMEALLEQQASLHERLEKREVVWVKVVNVTAEYVQVDIGEKQEGQIPTAEFMPPAPPKASREQRSGEPPLAGEMLPKAGARIPVVLVSRGRGEDKPTRLSYEKARFQLGWEQALKAFAEKSRVRGTVTSAVKGGFLVDVAGVAAFLPASLADLRPVRKPEAMIHTGVRCYIIELNKEKKQLVLSRKAVLEEEAKKRRDKFVAKVKVGDTIIGRVSHVSSVGVFVDLGGIEGFIPTAELAWKDPEKAKQGFSHNQKMRMRIIRIEPETGKVTLGIKQLTPNPADALKKKYPPKMTVKGKVTEIRPDGVRVEIGANVAAFCPITELPQKSTEPVDTHGHRRGGPPKISADQAIWPAAGDSVQMIVLGVNYTTFEVTASIRRFEEIESRKRIAQYLKGSPRLTLGQILTSEEDQ